MLSSPSGRKSMDNLSPLSPIRSQSEYPLHRPVPGPGSPHGFGRRGSIASSIHSIGGTLDTSSNRTHSVAESGQNAISTLLQPPIVRTGLLPHTSVPASATHKPPTARDIPPVTLTNIETVDSADFKPYLSQVGALYEQLRRVKDNEEESGGGRRGSKHDEAADSDEGHLRPGRRDARRSSVTSLSSINSIEAPGSVRRSSPGVRARGAQGPPPLSTIPNVYFDEDFHLENPRTFDVVSERSEVVQQAPGSGDDKATGNGTAAAPRKALATNAILQEKLSWYMDTIEMHLINSISTASTTFFTALGSLRGLHSEAADSVDRIKALRTELAALDDEIAQSGLDIVQKRRRRENVQQLNDAVLQLRHIVEGVAACESLVDEGQVDQALSEIASLENLIAGEASDDDGPTARAPTLKTIQLRDLRGATALQGVNDDLDTLRFRVGRAYETRFVNVLVGDLRRHLETVTHQEVLQRWGSASMRSKGHSREPSAYPAYLGATDELRAAILPNLVGLHRAKHIATATSAYRDIVLREVRNLIRRPLPSSNDDDNESMMSASTMSGGRGMSSKEKSSILARNLRALDSKDAEDLLKTVYIGVTETLRRLTTQVKVLLDVASSLSDTSTVGVKSPQSRSPLASPNPDRHAPPQDTTVIEIQEEIHKAMDVTNLMGQAVDIAQDKIVKVLKVRAEQSSYLPLIWFLRYFTLNLYFANECEAISGRSGTALKTIVNGHIREFVQHHGDGEKQKLAQGMESDQWNAKDFNEKDTALLNRVLESSTKDAEAWLDGTRIWLDYTLQDEVNGSSDPALETNGNNASGAKEKARSAVVDGESFLLPNSAVLCLEGMSHFLHLMTGIPSMTTDVATSLIGYLHLFNSRCTQLILGAGATRSAGLKNITTRHLALASQALSLVVHLIPHVREFVRRRAGVANLMGEFDKVRRMLQEHQNSIYDKLVEIMSGRAAQHAKAIKTIDWDADGAGKAEDSVHPYMETLAKETTVLHRVLTKHLPEGSVHMIMGPVFSSYKDQLGTVFDAADPKTEAGRNSMRRDLEHLKTKLGKIEGFESTGEHLGSIINSKQVEAAPAEPAAEASSSSSSSSTSGAEAEAEAEESADGAAKEEDKEKPSGPDGTDGAEVKEEAETTSKGGKSSAEAEPEK